MIEPNEMKPLWMVFGVGGRGPAYQHDTEAAAIREAERLAEMSPGDVFVVLEATQAIRARKFDRFDLRTAPSPPGLRVPNGYDVDDGIPF